MSKVTTNVDQLFQVALEHHQAGRLAEAERLYRQILAQQPNYADALHLLGVLAAQMGRSDIAVNLIRRAIDLQGDFPEAHNNLGNALKDKGHLDQAIAAYRQAIALQGDFAEAHNNLGTALNNKGQLDEAIAAYRQAIALRRDFAEAYSNLGRALKENGQLDEAVTACSQAIALRPNLTGAHINLGIALYEKGRLEEAIAVYRHAIATGPNHPEAHTNLGNALGDTGQLDEAIASHRQAIALRTNFPGAHNNLGNALRDRGQLDEAIAAYRQAIALRPNYPEAHSNLGIALNRKGQVDEAIAAYRQAIALKPNYPEAYSNLGNALKASGQLDEAIGAFRQAVALNPELVEAHSNFVFTLNYHPGVDAAAVAAEARCWNRQHAEPLAKLILSHCNDRTLDRRMRIGYVSADFQQHAVAWFVLPLLTQHDHERYEIYCYAQVPAPDRMTQQLRAHADHWHNIVGLTDDQAAELIRAHQIDILIDLAGHSAHNRLLLFARKPAPLQVTWLGYPATTGLTTIDYRLTDALADPPGLTEACYSEELLRLPVCAWCYLSLGSPPITPRPQQPITFGCFNNFSKITAPMLQLWAGILQSVSNSRLLLKSVALADDSTRRHIRDLMQSYGIAAARLKLEGHTPSHADHLALYHQMDIALDTFPYHGTTTTCEALWMGVPVVTLAGQSHVSRVGVSLLSNAGLPELIAQSVDQYVEIAATLAHDQARLAQLRSTLRVRMQRSPLMDAPRFARDIENAYRRMWTQWCRRG